MAVLLVVMVLPIENVLVVPGIGGLGRVAGVLLIIAAIPSFLARGGLVMRHQSVVVLLMALYVLWAFAGLLWSLEPSTTISYITTFAQLLILVIVIWQVCVTDNDRRLVQQAYVIGCMLAVLDGVRNFIAGNEAVFQRFAVSNTDPNDYALILALSIPMAWDLFAHQRAPWRLLNLLFVPLALVAIILSGSRGGAIAAVVGLMAFPIGFASLDRFGKRTLVVILTAVIMAVPFVWSEIVEAVGSNIERISTVGSEITSGTLNERSVIWEAGMEAFTARPLIGVGGGAFPAAIEKSSGLRELAHNTFVSVAVETGVVGLLLFVGIIVVVAVPLVRYLSFRTMPGLILLATLLIGITPLTWEFRKPTWLVIALLLVMTGVQLGGLAVSKARRINLPRLAPNGEHIGEEGT